VKFFHVWFLGCKPTNTVITLVCEYKPLLRFCRKRKTVDKTHKKCSPPPKGVGLHLFIKGIILEKNR